MQLSKSLLVYPNSRSIRRELALLSSNTLLSKYTTIGEFEKKATLVSNRVFIDEDTRVLLLKEASRFDSFKALDIDSEFFAFLKNSKFIFSFFDELALERVEIDSLFGVDYYAQFTGHLEILKLLKDRYHKLLEERGYIDSSLLPYIYEINEKYIKKFDSITLFLEGYLNRFEFELFDAVSKLTTLHIIISTNEFNQKMIERFGEFGLSLQKDMEYQIDFSTKTIKSKKRIDRSKSSFKIYATHSKMMQIAFIKDSLYRLIKRGVKAEKIAVIVPDSKIVPMIDLMDDENNFNFAMGHSFATSEIFQKLNAIYEFLQDQNYETSYRLKRYGFDDLSQKDLIERYKKSFSEEELQREFLSFINDSKESEAVEIYEKELHLFAKLFPALKKYKFLQILHLFLNRLKNSSIDDVNGGKVTVMELLESRGVEFDGVIVVDFNEGVVPQRSDKDLFLSSELRAMVKLPTSKDRESLQKYFYKRVFDRAKYIYISYIDDEQNSPSRFLDELGLVDKTEDINLRAYHNILFQSSKSKRYKKEYEIEFDYDFSSIELSSSRLSDYFECPRRYYYKYIRSIKDASIPKDENPERLIGIYLHEALRKFYQDRSSIKDEQELYLSLQRYLYKKSQNDISLKFYVDIWLGRLKKFIRSERDYFKKGFIVKWCEKELKSQYMGLNFVGKIDRIDSRDEKLYIVDYKSGKIKQTPRELEKETNFQLQIYTILASSLGEVKDACYYDLKEGKRVYEDRFDEKMSFFDERLKSLKSTRQNFYMCEDIKFCLYCPYKIICGRDL